MQSSDLAPPALGLLEARSLAKGLAALDRSAKEAEVLVRSTLVFEPGRLLYLLAGEVDAVRAALRAGRAALGAELEGELFLAHPHPGLLEAVTGSSAAAAEALSRAPAVGLIECRTVAAGLLAADAAAKEAHVRLARVKAWGGMGGKALVVLSGDTADVESALAAGAAAAEAQRALIRTEQVDAPAAALRSALAALA